MNYKHFLFIFGWKFGMDRRWQARRLGRSQVGTVLWVGADLLSWVVTSGIPELTEVGSTPEVGKLPTNTMLAKASTSCFERIQLSLHQTTFTFWDLIRTQRIMHILACTKECIPTFMFILWVLTWCQTFVWVSCLFFYHLHDSPKEWVLESSPFLQVIGLKAQEGKQSPESLHIPCLGT